MRRTIVVVLSVSLLSLWGVSAEGQSEGVLTVPSLRGSDTVVDLDGDFTLSGTVRSDTSTCYSGVNITIRRDEHDDVVYEEPADWPVVAETTTSEEGNYSVTLVGDVGANHVALVEPAPAGCRSEASDPWSVKVRADITLETAQRSSESGRKVHLTATVSPECASVTKERNWQGIGGTLYLERLEADGWDRLTSRWDRSEGCSFTFIRQLRRTDVYRVVGEGHFVLETGYVYHWIGRTTEPLMVREARS